jgi:hypothetical protein
MQKLTTAINYNHKILKYLDENNKYSPFKSEIIRMAYKDQRLIKEDSKTRLIDSLFGNKRIYKS